MEREQILNFDGRYLQWGGGISFLANLLIFKVIGPVCSRKFTSSYETLKPKEQTEWNERYGNEAENKTSEYGKAAITKHM